MQIGKSMLEKRIVYQHEWKLLLFTQIEKFSAVNVKIYIMYIQELYLN